jgi:hypothetical protein
VPWLAGLRAVAEPVLRTADWRSNLNAAAQAKALRNYRDLPIRFVQQADLPSGTAYEAFIGETGCIPTRANRHDFFNALVWLSYPQVKKQLNALQAIDIARSAPSQAPSSGNVLRGKLRDAATIFDENAALFASADEELTAALRAHRWQDLFVTRRAAFGRTWNVRLFGHALMEKLVAPYKAITAHAWVVTVEPGFFSLSDDEQRMQLDVLVGRQLAQGLATSNFTPLPVLGVPGWCALQDEAYYADQFVFRPKRGNRSGIAGKA